MGDLIGGLMELVARVWHADSKMRDLTMGELPLERDSRRSVARLCGGAIAALIFCMLLWSVLR